MRSVSYKPLLITLTIALLAVGSAARQSLSNRHRLELQVGLRSFDTETNVSIGGVTTDVSNSGVLGGVRWSYYTNENLAVYIGAGGLSLNVDVSSGVNGVRTSNAVVGALYFGTRYYPIQSTMREQVRPFVSVHAGPAFGTQGETSVSTSVLVQSREEVALMGYAGVGVDAIVSRSFVIGADCGYNMMTDFSEPIGSEKNYSGIEFTIGCSLMLGHGR